MKIIGRNEESDLKLYLYPDGRMGIVSKSLYKLPNEEIAERNKHKCHVVDNFVFEATIVPTRWGTGRQSGSIYFKDADSNTVFRLTQRNLFELLDGIISGRIVVRDNGFFGLYTFDGKGNTLTVGPYKYE